MAGSAGWRVAAIVVLGILPPRSTRVHPDRLAGLRLGRRQWAGIGLFAVVAVGALLALLWLLTAVVGRRVRPTTALLRARRPGSRRRARRAHPLRLVEARMHGPGAGDHRGGSHVRGREDDVRTRILERCLQRLARRDGDGRRGRGALPERARGGRLDGRHRRRANGSPGGEAVDTRELRAERDGAVFTIALESWSGRTSAAIRVDASAAQAE